MIASIRFRRSALRIGFAPEWNVGPQQAIHGATVAAGDVRHEPRVGLEQHLGRGVTELSGDPFGVFAGSEPQGRRRVAHLVGAAKREIQVPEEGIPDSLGEVVELDRLAARPAEHEAGLSISGGFPPKQRLAHRGAHLDISLCAVRLGVLDLAANDRFPDQNLTALEIHILPLQAIDLTGTHSGQHAHGQVVAVVAANCRNEALNLFERERIDVDPLLSQTFDVHDGVTELVTVRRFAQDLTENLNDPIDGPCGQRRVAAAPFYPCQIGAKGENIGLGNGANRHIAERRNQVTLER